MKLLVGALWAAVAAAAGVVGVERGSHGGETARADNQRDSAVQFRSSTDPAFLEVDGRSLTFRGQEVFLSGANQPWVSYGNDFGNNQPNGIRCTLQESVTNVSTAGGNSIRMWLFVEGSNIPAFDSSGDCTGTDGANTLISDLRDYARFAASQNVFITLTLWNGAVVTSSDNVRALVTDADKLQTFIDKVRSYPQRRHRACHAGTCMQLRQLVNVPNLLQIEIAHARPLHIVGTYPACHCSCR